MSTSLVPVSLRGRVGDASQLPPHEPYTFVIPSPSGGPLVEVDVSEADLAEARARWRGNTWTAVLSVLGFTLALCAGALLDRRQHTRSTREFVAVSAQPSQRSAG